MPRKATALPKAKASSPPALDFSKSRQKLAPETFYRFAREYPSTDGISIYVYRLTPRIDRGLAGIEDSNIEVLTNCRAIDEEYLLRQHGSGKYHLKFSDANKPGGLTEVARSTVEIYDPSVPPLVNPVELVVGAAGNDPYIQKYLREGWTVQENKLTPPAGADKANETLAQTIKELAARPAAAPAVSDAIVNRLVDAALTRNNGGDDLDRVERMARLMSPSADMMRMFSEMVRDRPAAAAAANPLETFKETASTLKELGWTPPGGAAASGGTDWAAAIAAIPQIIIGGIELLRHVSAMKAAESGPRLVPRAAAPPAAAAAELPAAELPAAGDGEEVESETGEGESMFGQLGLKGLGELKAVGLDALSAFTRGISGRDFAVSLYNTRANGPALYDAICELGADLALAYVSKVDPNTELGKQLAGRSAELRAWLESFIQASQGPPAAAPGKVA